MGLVGEFLLWGWWEGVYYVVSGVGGSVCCGVDWSVSAVGLVGGCLLWGWWEGFCCGVDWSVSAVGLIGACLLWG